MSKKTYNEYLKPIVVLCSICIVASLLLAITNYFTAPVIKANEEANANAAFLEVLPEADTFEEITEFSTTDVLKALKAKNGAGYVLQVQGQGFGGKVPAVVSFDKDGKIKAVKFMENEETKGYGSRVYEEPEFSAQFSGMPAENFKLGDIDALSGATVTSTAAVSAINAAINGYKEVALGEEAVVEKELTPEEIRLALMPGATTATKSETALEGIDEIWQGDNGSVVYYAQIEGYEYQASNIIVAVGFDSAGTITGLWVDASGQSQGIGTQVADAAYTEKYIGIADVDTAKAVDAIAGATESSDGVNAAVRRCITKFNEAKGAE